jgi:hypothetical protein
VCVCVCVCVCVYTRLHHGSTLEKGERRCACVTSITVSDVLSDNLLGCRGHIEGDSSYRCDKTQS